jgi:hypothetical protein
MDGRSIIDSDDFSWGLQITLLCMLSDNDANHNRDVGAFICTSRRVRAAAMRMTRQDFLGRYVWAGHPLVAELFDHPQWVKNFFWLNSRLHRVALLVDSLNVTRFDLYCLTGQADLIQLLIDHQKAIRPFSIVLRYRYCLLAAESDKAALTQLLNAFQWNRDDRLAPITDDVTNDFLYFVCCYGTPAALGRILSRFSRQHIVDYLLRTNLLVSLSLEYSQHPERDQRHAEILCVLLAYCHKPLQPKLKFLLQDFLKIAIQQDFVPLVTTILEFGIKLRDEDLLFMGTSDALNVLKSQIAACPTLVDRLRTDEQRLGTQLLEKVILNVDGPAHLLAYLLDEVKLNIDTYINNEPLLNLAARGYHHNLVAILDRKPCLEMRDVTDDVTALQNLLMHRPNVVCNRYHNMCELIKAGANVHAPFRNGDSVLQRLMQTQFLNIDSPVWASAFYALIAAGANVNIPNANGVTVFSSLLKCWELNLTCIRDYLSVCKVDLTIQNNREAVGYHFCRGCRDGNLGLISYLLDMGADLTDSVEGGNEMLQAKKDDFHKVSAFKVYANMDGAALPPYLYGVTALDLAICGNKVEVVKLFIQHFTGDAIRVLLSDTHIHGRFNSYDCALLYDNPEILAILDSCLQPVIHRVSAGF